jgi:pyrimidine operon attenuation protein / uracil phosphoribosyltransferase
METLVLNTTQIEQKITRIAHEIIENTFNEKHLYIAGISGNGTVIAKKLVQLINKFSDQQTTLFSITLEKDAPLRSNIQLSCNSSDLDNATVILVDDVINSGRTMQYALLKILESPVKTVKTVALVDRMHRRYPIHADYVGLTLSTTLKERVEVDFKGEPVAYLA